MVQQPHDRADPLAERDVPILVVTIPSLTARGSAGYTVERYWAELFNRWGIGSQKRNYGMLLLVSVGDRAARIELGADYAGRHDASAAQVMDNLILPEFRAGRYPEGILAGVRGMDAMARGIPVPSAPIPWYAIPLPAGVFTRGGALAYSHFRNGRSGWSGCGRSLPRWVLGRRGRHGPVVGEPSGSRVPWLSCSSDIVWERRVIGLFWTVRPFPTRLT